MKKIGGKIYQFGRFSLDAGERLLFDGVDTIALTPKAFDTLLLLVENAGHVLSKEQMLSEVWEDSFVEENNLAQNISLLRKALGQDKGAKFIETVSKRGYRFIAPVSLTGESAGEEKENEEPRSVTVERTRARIVIEENDDLPVLAAR